MAYALPDKPSIAVLPFMNMSDDKEQEYFADGLAEEINNALSKVDQIFVIARNSTFYYKGKPVRVQQVAEDLGVRYVLEGSVRKSGETVRVTAQLVDALNGRHILSESYDRDFKDILSVQDEITMNILSALQVAISKGEFAQTIAKGTKNLKAYLKTMQAHQFGQQYNKEAMVLSRRCADEAIELDPEYATGYFVLGAITINEIFVGANRLPRPEALNEALRLGEKAVALDRTSNGYAVMSIAYAQRDLRICSSARTLASLPQPVFNFSRISRRQPRRSRALSPHCARRLPRMTGLSSIFRGTLRASEKTRTYRR